MDAAELERALGPQLSAALARKGYSQLTTVQQAVLEPALEGRDLRVTSQTGSGKTLAIGFALSRWAAPTAAPAPSEASSPSEPMTKAKPANQLRALVIAPTRELARQTQAELQWLYADYPARVVAITGGTSFREERRELALGPRVVVGTPGRLLDHLQRGSIDPSALAAVVLDEADRLLDMGFREDLDAILGHAPKEHETHLVSATFPRAVRALADKVQRNAAHVEGTRLGEANADIDHVIHVIDPREKLGAVINILLANPEAQTLVFARTRADVSALTRELSQAGFAATAISGELDQEARTRALAAFKQGREAVLCATDVAARGIDVQDVTDVIHFEPPTSADAYTHRAGRTGRAGRKGTSRMLITPAQVVPATRVLRAGGIPHRFEAVPSAELIRKQQDERIVAELTADGAADATDARNAHDARGRALAQRLLATNQSERVLLRLLKTLYARGAQPRELRAIAPRERDASTGPRERAGGYGRDRNRDRNERDYGDRKRDNGDRPGPNRSSRGASDSQPGPRGARNANQDERYIPFRVSWGGRQGADARRLLAIACRRGEIRGTDVGVIRIEADHSIVEVAARVAETFSVQAARPDPRDRRVLIRPVTAAAPQTGRAARPRTQGHAPPKRRG